MREKEERTASRDHRALAVAERYGQSEEAKMSLISWLENEWEKAKESYLVQLFPTRKPKLLLDLVNFLIHQALWPKGQI